MSHEITPSAQIRRTNPAGSEFWSSRDFAEVLGYVMITSVRGAFALTRPGTTLESGW